MIDLSEERLSYTHRFSIGSGETDMFARLRLGALVNLMIQAAVHSSDDIGFGFKDIQKQQLFWVCSRLTLEIEQPIHWKDDIIIETWPKDIERIIYLRDFLVKSPQGAILARATSGWLAIDSNSKRPKRIQGTSAAMFTHLKLKQALQRPPEKLSPLKTGELFEYKARYFDIDLNKHVTASRYIDWMMDGFPLEFHQQHYPRLLSINYIKETLPHETISLLRKQQESTSYLFEGTNKGAESTAFRGQINF